MSSEKSATEKNARTESSGSAPFEETPWVPQERSVLEPEIATAATQLLLIEAARHSFRLEPLVGAGILVRR